MSIIVSKNGKKAERFDKSDFEKEDYLQNYIHQNPESIPVYEIEDEKKLFVVAREFSTESGPIDALAIDKDGDIYVVETKLYKNSDKRKVVAQALDYGASLWRHSDYNEFMSVIKNEIQNEFSLPFEEKTKDYFEIDDEQIVLMLDAIRYNLLQGKIKFVILMDTIEDSLKDLIVYINQNSQFDIYAVQMEYYKFEEYEIMIPKLFGVEVKKNVGVRSTGSSWSPERFLAEARNKIKDDKTYNILSGLYDFIRNKADVFDFGKGNESGSMTFKYKDSRTKAGLVSLFTIWTNGSIRFRFRIINHKLGKENLKLYFEKLKGILDPQFLTEDILDDSIPKFSMAELFRNENKLKQFEDAILEFIKEIKK